MATFGGLMAGVSEAASQVFDYIMNTQPAYKKLGEAVQEFQRELSSSGGGTYHSMMERAREGLVQPGRHAKWKRLVFDAVRLARVDYRKHFSKNEDAPFMQQKMLDTVTVFDVMKLALDHRDRFSGLGGLATGESKEQHERRKIKWIYAYMEEVRRHAIKMPRNHVELLHGHMVALTMSPKLAAKRFLDYKNSMWGYSKKALR